MGWALQADEHASSSSHLPRQGCRLAASHGQVSVCVFWRKYTAYPQAGRRDYYDQIPDDILECWAGCLWSIQAMLEIGTQIAEYKALMATFQKLGAAIYFQTGLRHDEFFDERVMKTFDALSQRFAQPLKLNPDRVKAGHKAAAASLRSAEGQS
jgi:hypothetical protein